MNILIKIFFACLVFISSVGSHAYFKYDDALVGLFA